MPKTRPTVFWEAQQVEMRFDNAKYESGKEERQAKHTKKKVFMLEKQQKAMGEVKKLMDDLSAKEQVEADLKKQLEESKQELKAKKKAWVNEQLEIKRKADEEARKE